MSDETETGPRERLWADILDVLSTQDTFHINDLSYQPGKGRGQRETIASVMDELEELGWIEEVEPNTWRFGELARMMADTTDDSDGR